MLKEEIEVLTKLDVEYFVSSHSMEKPVSKNKIIEHLNNIYAKKEKSNIYPTVYINEYYKEDLLTEDIEYIAMKVSNTLKNARMENADIVDEFIDYELAKSNICLKLINAEENKEMLFDVPHRRFHNLAICYIYIVNNIDGIASVLIKNEHLKRWDVKEKDIYDQAYINTMNKLPFKIWNLADIVNTCYNLELNNIDIPMKVVSNEYKIFGANTMLYTDLMKEIGKELDSDFYIIPSSIHEIIVLSNDLTRTNKEILEMVIEVNKTVVSKEEKLADSVYFYDRALEEVIWIC